MALTRRKFSEEFKRALVRQIVAGVLTYTAALEKHKLTPSALARWKKEYGDEVAAPKSGGALVVSSKVGKLTKPSRPSHAASLTEEQRAKIRERLLAGHRSIDIARDYNIDPATVYYYKKVLRMRGEAMPTRVEVIPAPASAASKLPPEVQLRDAITVANSIERDIMQEYTSGKVRELSARDIKTLMLRKMLKGEM